MNVSPVRYGTFRSGSEPVLWRPGLDHDRLHRHAAWRCLVPDAGLYALGGVVALVIGAANRSVLVPAVAAGAVLITAAALIARYEFLRFGHDLSLRSVPWRTDRGRGQWYFRATDFLDRGTPAAATMAAQIIDAAHLTHSGPAAAWIGHAQLAAVHQLAWDTLLALYQAPTAHEDLQPVLARLTLVTAHIRDANRRLTHAEATTRTDDLLAHVTALHDILPTTVTP